MERQAREKFNHAQREISVGFHCSVSSGEFTASQQKRKKNRSLSNLARHLTSLSGLSINQVVTDNRRFCRFDSTSCSFQTFSDLSLLAFLLADLPRSTVISVTLEKHLRRSKTISRIASYRGPCSAGYDEGVRRLRSRRATMVR